MFGRIIRPQARGESGVCRVALFLTQEEPRNKEGTLSGPKQKNKGLLRVLAFCRTTDSTINTKSPHAASPVPRVWVFGSEGEQPPENAQGVLTRAPTVHMAMPSTSPPRVRNVIVQPAFRAKSQLRGRNSTPSPKP